MTAKYSGIDPERLFGVDGYVGNTPLIRLRRLSELTGCEILGKAEPYEGRGMNYEVGKETQCTLM